MYAEYLIRLLAPLGVYDLEETSVSGGAVYALGDGLDEAAETIDYVEREGNTATAQEEGLDRRESLFARRPAASTPEDRRAAIAALLQIDGDSLTPNAIDATLRGCGIKARAIKLGGQNLAVIFPEVAGIPPEFDQIQKIILDILPCHLGVEFYFRYLTWTECEEEGYTWNMVETAEYTWDTFQLAVPPEE